MFTETFLASAERRGPCETNMEDGEASGNNPREPVHQNDGVSTSCGTSDQPEENKQDEPEKEKQSDTKREKDSEQNDFYPFTM